jgi:Cu(I)/Ag(I) efflux system periplasmic protein CusF
MRNLKIAAVLASIVTSGAAFAQNVMVHGEVKKIDAAGGKITLKHGPIKNLEMDAMTMVLRVNDKDMLKNLKVGDKVKFEAERASEGVTITKMQKSK